MINRRLDATTTAIGSNSRVVIRVLELPGVAAFVVVEARVVVAFVEVFEDGGEDFRLFFGHVDAAGMCFAELAAAGGSEERREAEDIFVGGEEALFTADDNGYDWGG